MRKIRDSRFFGAEVRVNLPHLLMRLAQELFEQTEFVHQLQGRGMNGVAAKIAQEILVLFQNDHFDAGAREHKSRASFPLVRRQQCNSVSVFVQQFERAGSSVGAHSLYLKAFAREASVTALPAAAG
jgi:hypothetical protein